MNFPILQTERLTLREWTESDAPDLFEIYRHEHVVRYTPITAHTKLEDSVASAKRYKARFRELESGIVWAIESKKSGRIIGEGGVNRWMPNHFKAEIGFSFSQDVWGKGYASEAVRCFIDYLFTEFPLFKMNRLEATTDPRNFPSMKLLERLGFTQEGFFKDFEFEKGAFVDQYVYGLLRKDWEKRVTA